jgi:[acyl-carrier-protein] S-malonyltransferase
MDGAKAGLMSHLDALHGRGGLHAPRIPVYANLMARPYPCESSEMKRILVEQMVSPVLWKDCIGNMIADGVDVFIEVGAGSALASFIAKIDTHVSVMNVTDAEGLELMMGGIRNA